PRDYVRPVKQAVDHWYAVRNADVKPEDFPKLDATIVDGDDVLITDTRPCGVSSSHLLRGIEAHLLLACDTSRTVSGLARQSKTGETEIRDTLASLQSKTIVIEMDGQFGSLPVLRNRQARLQTGGTLAHAQVSEAAAPEFLLRLV